MNETFGKRSLYGRVVDVSFHVLLVLCLVIGFAALGALLYTVLNDGLGEIDWAFISNYPSFNPALAGIRSALLGTIWLMVVCGAFVIPVGVATAIHLEEYADRTKWWNRALELNIQNLAAVPSIVYGILGLAFLVRGPFGVGRVVLAGALTLGLLVLPVVIITAREAIRSVPPSIREGSLALGATKWQTIWKQVLPASVSGIATGVILSLSRAIGETAPLILVGAATYVAFDPKGLLSPFTALPLQIFSWLSQPQAEFKLLAAGAIIVLFGILIVMNAIAIGLRNRFAHRW